MKHKIQWLGAAAVAVVVSAFGTPSLPAGFDLKLSRAALSLTVPEHMAEVPLARNVPLHYDYGIKFPDDSFEVRFAVHPLDSELMAYRAYLSQPKSGETLTDPNSLYGVKFQAVLMNITGKTKPLFPIEHMDVKALRPEFNADWGSLAFVTPSKKFGAGYSHCAALAIHRNNTGDAYVFFLFNNQKELHRLLGSAYDMLKFREPVASSGTP